MEWEGLALGSSHLPGRQVLGRRGDRMTWGAAGALAPKPPAEM